MKREAAPQPKIPWDEMLDQALTLPPGALHSYSRLYDYSIGNQAFLAYQGCPVEPVATYNRWQEVDRQVVKGAKAYSILRPIQIRKRAEAEGEDDTFYTRFKTVRSVFPVSMTEGEPLPEAEPAKWDKKRALGALAIKEVNYELYEGNTQGYSYERNFAINPVAKYPIKTMMHELAHIELGHTDEEPKPYIPRGIQEFQAESTAYIVVNELDVAGGIDLAESRAYIKSWLRGITPSDIAIRGVFKAANSILKAGRNSV